MKAYQEPSLLQILRSLHPRMELSPSDLQQYERLKKGHEGEQQFALILASIENDWIPLHSLLLEYQESLFQLDAVLITSETIFLFDIKNIDGEYYIEEENWFTITGKDMKNPLHQLHRSTTLFWRFLQDHGLHFSVSPYLIFLNPEFTLYQAPRNLPAILLTQLPAFIRKLQTMSSRITKHHKKLAEILLRSHIEETLFSRPPEYHYEQLKKGVVCSICQSLETMVEGQTVICRSCGERERLRSAVLRSVEELQILFPNEKLTTNIVYDWCGGLASKKSIRNTLQKHFIQIGHEKSAQYIPVQKEHQILV